MEVDPRLKSPALLAYSRILYGFAAALGVVGVPLMSLVSPRFRWSQAWQPVSFGFLALAYVVTHRFSLPVHRGLGILANSAVLVFLARAVYDPVNWPRSRSDYADLAFVPFVVAVPVLWLTLLLSPRWRENIGTDVSHSTALDAAGLWLGGLFIAMAVVLALLTWLGTHVSPRLGEWLAPVVLVLGAVALGCYEKWKTHRR